MDPLAARRQRLFEQYHLAVADTDVYREAREAIEVSGMELSRSLQQVVQGLEQSFGRYVDEKTMAMAKEAERAIEEAQGKLRYAEQLKQRALEFPREFRQRYGLQEGENGITEA